MSASAGDTQVLPHDWLMAQYEVRYEGSDDIPTIPPALPILQIIPENKKAKKAFHEMIKLKNENKAHEHHAKFLVCTCEKPLEEAIDRPVRGDDETTTEEDECSSKAKKPEMVWDGYYSITTHSFPLFRAGWALGRGSGKKDGKIRNVDILLVAPDSKLSLKPAAVHIILAIHPRSGTWLLRANEKFHFGPSLEPVSQYDYRCLLDPQTLFEVSKMRYSIQFTIDSPSAEKDYVEARDNSMRVNELPPIDSIISGIPFKSDRKFFNSAIWRHGLGSGGFGNVFEGVEPETGELRAIKRICIRSQEESREVSEELQTLKDLKDVPGIVQMYDFGNSLQGKNPKADRYPLDFYIIMEKGQAFSKVDWAKTNIQDWVSRCRLLKGLLQGLVKIHKTGWMHRDITPMNILLFDHDQEPPRACLSDFGKLCRSACHTSTRLAAWPFLPPELQQGKSVTYDQKLDIWMLGLACVHTWYPQMIEGWTVRNPGDYRLIMGDLQKYASPSLPLPFMLAKMMAWRSQDRPTAEEAFNDPCMRSMDSLSAKRIRHQ